MSTDLTALQTAVSSLQSTAAAIAPAFAANATLNVKVIKALDDFAGQLAGVGSDPQAIADLTSRVTATVADLQGQAQAVAVQNAALQVELDKVAQPTALSQRA